MEKRFKDYAIIHNVDKAVEIEIVNEIDVDSEFGLLPIDKLISSIDEYTSNNKVKIYYSKYNNDSTISSLKKELKDKAIFYKLFDIGNIFNSDFFQRVHSWF